MTSSPISTHRSARAPGCSLVGPCTDRLPVFLTPDELVLGGLMAGNPESSTPTAPSTGVTEVGDWVGVLPSDRNSATRQHRIQQGRWRTAVARWPAGPPQNDVR